MRRRCSAQFRATNPCNSKCAVIGRNPHVALDCPVQCPPVQCPHTDTSTHPSGRVICRDCGARLGDR